VDAAKDAAAASASNARIRLASDEGTASLRITAPHDGGPYGAAMAALCGGTLTREGDELVLSLPTLLLLRQRERAAAAE